MIKFLCGFGLGTFLVLLTLCEKNTTTILDVDNKGLLFFSIAVLVYACISLIADRINYGNADKILAETINGNKNIKRRKTGKKRNNKYTKKEVQHIDETIIAMGYYDDTK